MRVSVSMTRRILTNVCALLFVLVKSAAFAETNTIESVEWKTMDSPLVVRGRVTSAKDRTNVSFRDGTITIAIGEVLKGSWSQPSLEVFTDKWEDDATPRHWLESGKEYLFFLCIATEERYHREVAGKWVLRNRDESVFDLTIPKGAYTAEMAVVKEGNQMLDLVRQWSTRSSREIDFGPGSRKGKVGAIIMGVPFRSQIYSENAVGSAVLMVVPAEEKHRELALKLIRSDKPYERAHAADILGNLADDPESTRLLESLLDDPAETQATYSDDELSEIVFPVRHPAWVALVRLGHKPAARPISKRSPTEEEQRRRFADAWNRSIVRALGKEWQITLIEALPAPPGWTRLQGADGFVLTCQRTDEQSAASFPLFVMRKQWLSSNSPVWQAECPNGALDNLMRYEARDASSGKRRPTDETAVYLGVRGFGAQGACHIFVLPTCPEDSRAALVREWELKIVERR